MILHAVIWSVLGASSIEPRAFASVLELLGYQTTTHARRPSPGLLVIPSTAALSPKQAAQVRDFIRGGGDAVIAGTAALQAVLGVRPSDARITVKDVTDLSHPERYLRWNPTDTVERFEPPPGADVLMHDQPTHQPLAFSGALGKGHYLALAAAFDTSSALGTSRYPYFAEYLRHAFGYRPLVTHPHIEAYFDPGFRSGADLSTLIDGWQRAGIRVIYAATWYDFDYPRLLELCHRAGIAVYAWLALPMVNRQFWDDHPEWRAARTGWRYPLNFEIPEARSAAFDWVRDAVARYDWDGINLAEMNYESSGNVTNVTAWHREVLEGLASKDIEVVVTTFDSVAAPGLRDSHGVDSVAIAGLMRNFRFMPQLEDSYELWPKAPDRYLSFARPYDKIVPDRRRFMFDVNVVGDRDVDKSNLPSALATGTEFLQLLHAASGGPAGRVAVYSESTVAPQDWDFAAVALAAGVRIQREVRGLRVHSPHTVAVRDDAGRWELVPAGVHLITSPEAAGIRLTAISCELLDWQAKSGRARFTYDSPGRCAAAFDTPPAKIWVDGKAWTMGVFPRGRHRVEIE